MIKKNKLSYSQIFTKMASFCAYQERCVQEVREKLLSFDISKLEMEQLLEQLIDENFLHEERFAIAYVGGKFRTKQWGRVKIKYELQQRRIDKGVIRLALNTIDETVYTETLLSIIEKKRQQEPDITPMKLYNYLLSKGYESELVQKYLKK